MAKRTTFHRHIITITFMLACALLLNGCSVPKRTVYQPEPERDSPARTLLADAEQSLRTGKINQAEMHIERALRVDPGNGELWHFMATIKDKQGNYSQAVQFCLKSNSLAGANNSLTRRNWLLIENAYSRMGNMDKAEDARLKAYESR